MFKQIILSPGVMIENEIMTILETYNNSVLKRLIFLPQVRTKY